MDMFKKLPRSFVPVMWFENSAGVPKDMVFKMKLISNLTVILFPFLSLFLSTCTNLPSTSLPIYLPTFLVLIFFIKNANVVKADLIKVKYHTFLYSLFFTVGGGNLQLIHLTN